jgi:1-acyl-sn-glycerol-3-phosphate acyltransferase
LAEPASKPLSYRLVIRFFRILVWAFFRKVTVTGLEHVPTSGGGILVSWHPNGLIDPGLLLTQFPRQVVFGARHGLFQRILSHLQLPTSLPVLAPARAPPGDVG